MRLDQSESIGPWQSRCSHVDSFDTSVLQCSHERISCILKVTLENKFGVEVDPRGAKVPLWPIKIKFDVCVLQITQSGIKFKTLIVFMCQ